MFYHSSNITNGLRYELTNENEMAQYRIAKAFQSTPSETAAHQHRSRWLQADLAFHTCILHIAKNSRIERILQEFRVMSQTFRNKQSDPILNDARAYLANLAWAWRDHRRILRSLQQRDPHAARLWMSIHIKRAKRRIMQTFDKHDLAEK